MTSTLPWFPPAPAAGPLSILQLPPDDWALEPKIDGIRVIWFEGRVYTRHGALLSLSKGAERLMRMLSGIDATLDGEWVPGPGIYVVFDLPDCPLDYDGRRELLDDLLCASSRIETCPNSPLCTELAGLSMTTTISRVRLVACYTAGDFPQVYSDVKRSGAEGVVLKRRRSVYATQVRASVEQRDWLKRRFEWD